MPQLHADRRGRGRPVVLLHGFTQTRASWPNQIGDALVAAGHQVIALDAPGHGRSADVRADLAAGADLMVSAVGGDAPAAWIGYSMGGRFALYVALRHPEAVSRLVLVSTSAGIDDAEERAARRRSDEALAVNIETEGVEAFVDWWLRTPLFAALPPDAAARSTRVENSPGGLASSLRLAGAGTMDPPLWADLPRIDIPVLVVAGQRDAKYTALASRLVEAIGPNATAALIEHAGHACHLERPRPFLDAVVPFLSGARSSHEH